MNTGVRIGSLGLMLALSTTTFSDDFFGAVETESETSNFSTSPYSFNGWVQQKVGYGFGQPDALFNREKENLTRLELSAESKLDWQINDQAKLVLAGRLTYDGLPDLGDDWSGYEFSEAEQDHRGGQFQWRDSYLDYNWGETWLRAGMQTLALGESETLAVTDVLSTRDMTWIGQADLEDIRRPVPVVTFNTPVLGGQLSALALWQAGTDETAPAGAEFDPWIAFRAMEADVSVEDAEQSLETALQWQATLGSADVSLIAADLNTNQLTVGELALVIDQGAPVMTESGLPLVSSVTLEQDRYQMVGAALSQALGSWLIKGETAFKQGLVQQPQGDLIADPWPEKDLLQAMAGAEFSGLGNWLLTAEVNATQILDHDDQVLAQELALGWGARARWTGMNDRLSWQSSLIALPSDSLSTEETLIRHSLGWTLNDDWKLDVTAVSYQADDEGQSLYVYRNNDSVNASIRYSF